MPEPKKRIIVDGIDFRQVFVFPVLFRAVTGAMQPPRLLIALFMVLLLVTFGRIWDGVASPAVHPAGLDHGEVTAEDAEAAQRVYLRAMMSYARDRVPDGEATKRFTAGQTLQEIERGYRAQRDDELGREELQRRDREYLATVERIHEVRPKGIFEATAAHAVGSFRHTVLGTLYLQPVEVLGGFTNAVIVMPVALWTNHKWFTIVFGLFFVLVMSVGGGAVARMTASEIAGRQRLRVLEALQFTFVRWPRFFTAPLLPLALAALLAVVVVILGVLMTIPWIDVIAGLLYLPALLIGFGIAFLLLIYAAGAGMIVPAMATENCDGPDAVQRSYAYVISRPLHLLGYVVVAIIALALGYLVVSLFAAATLNLTAALYGALTTNSAMSAAGGFSPFDLSPARPGEIHSAHSGLAAGFIGLWQTLVVNLVWAYVVAFLFSAATIVYLLMRRASDGQDIEEIWRPGLVPGTLAPMPPAVVEHATKAEAQADNGESH